MNLREERLGTGRCQKVESGVQVAEGNRHQAALGQGSDPAGGEKELLADLEGKAESCGWTRNGESSW